MAVEAEDLESELIENVCERIRDQLPDEQAPLAEAFVRQYYRRVPAEDLAVREISDLHGAAIAHWRLAYERAPGEAKVRVYNPDPAPDGWSSPHTVIEIVSDDMPFIVDSVTMELAREGFTIDLVIHPVIGVQRDRDGRAVAVLHPDAITSEAWFEPGAELLSRVLPGVLDGADREAFHVTVAELMDAGVPPELASRVATMPSLPHVFDLVDVAEDTGRDLQDVTNTYFRLASRLQLAWLRDRIYELPRANRWQALARAALREDLLGVHRELTREVLESASDGERADAAIEGWESHNRPKLERCVSTLADIRASRTYDTTIRHHDSFRGAPRGESTRRRRERRRAHRRGC
jgi:NAD-specific glutamate dehydrogenase